MKKVSLLLVLAVAAIATFFVLRFRAGSHPLEIGSDLSISSQDGSPQKPTTEQKATQHSIRDQEVSEKSGATSQSIQGSDSKANPAAAAAGAPTASNSIANKATREAEQAGLEPSIGTVKVLGHRGCDSNTPGWFLSVGTPEQYNFSVVDEGETLEVEPNTSPVTGNFEFVHCFDPRDAIGKTIRFTARVKALNVAQTALLRLRGEDTRRERNLFESSKLTGTFDWREITLVSKITPEVALLSYGLTFRGTGKLWMSHPRFEVMQ